MPTDPQLAGVSIGNPDMAAAQALRDLTQRIAALERQSTVQVGSGAPTSTPRNGTLYIDTASSKLYARIGGAWKSTAALT